MCDQFTYCPICQLPLKAINIQPDVHVSMCMSRSDSGELEECPQGVHCLSTDIFHYRDYRHNLLAEYRSSSDFVPPNIEIKPSPKKRKSPPKQPKRSSPRKKKKSTPKKSNSNKTVVASDEESDSELMVQVKKPRRNLKFNEKPIKESCSNKNNSSSGVVSLEKKLDNITNQSNTDSPLEEETTILKENCDSDPKGDSQRKKNTKLSEPSTIKPTVVNVSLNASDELRFTKSRSIASLSSLSVTTSGPSNADSEFETASESSNEQSSGEKIKVVLRKPVLTLDNVKIHEENLNSQPTTECNAVQNGNLEKDSSMIFNSGSSKTNGEKTNSCPKDVHDKVQHSNLVLKQPLLTLERLKVHDEILSQSKPFSTTKNNKPVKDGIESEANGSLYNTDFDDIIPGSMLDKELLKTIETKLDSPATTVHSCSEYSGNETNSTVSSIDQEKTDGESDSERFLLPPTSRRRVVTRRKSSNFLSSSSDSDIPLSKLVSKKPETALSKMTSVKGKVKAGKVLRISSKSPAYLNGKSLLNNNLMDTAITEASDNESDSGKSSAHTDISFVPSEKTNSSMRSDSALSAQSTDQLTASSKSSTYSSSESYSESRSSDPSYSEESDLNSISKSRRTKVSPRKDKKSPSKKHVVKSLSSLSEESTCLSSSSSSSEISVREKLLFRSKKISPKKSSPKLIKSPVKTKTAFKASTLGLLDTTDSDDKSEWQSLLSKMRNSCYPSDLKIDSEDSLTVVSSCSGSDTSHTSSMLPFRNCPFYKKIPDTPFAVDAFQYWNIPGVKIYFLSHFHSDHYIGLKKSFAQPIYCTQITANLVRTKLRVEEKWLKVIDLNQPQIISGVEVTALDANHCPGSAMFLFSLTNGRNYLHVGDFRASKAMTFYPSLRSVSISKLFLDTTYCSPQYCFPTQENVIARVVEIVRKHVRDHPRTLVVCGSYTIGKEKVFLGVAEAFDWRVWARPDKQRVFTCLNDPRINSRLVRDCRSANVHVLPMKDLQMRSLQQHLGTLTGAFTHVIGVKPTGWELNSKSDEFKVTSNHNITIYGVPYSEHSSFTELRDFVQFLQPHEVVPTVNVGSSSSRSKMEKHFSDWLKPQPQTDGKSDKQTKVSQYFKTK
ncbi:DNA cross-link repair 1A protein-like [Macrosteles quadrilineatus]|uniref:DNA cross-link repair 1A protein-like n=1 Tax=Macrosteles quadrilineatus TaxID=74068 RepID=UPI0023E32351|nr:DNA cross-link repair 1A protein-like [Macrosteles quadrilineatus]